jgi:adenosylcobinamide kinase/adenosylcobinamide-phosphate guanylyltransferase
VNIVLEGTAGPRGWPEPGCRCASCRRLCAAGTHHEPTRVRVDGVPLEDCPRREVPGGYDVRTPGGQRILFANGPGARPEPVPGTSYDAVLLDLVGSPDHLGSLRRAGAVIETTQVMAVHVDHRIGGPGELERRLGWWLHPRPAPHRTLLLGGARSGKSAEAELRLAAHPRVTYVATAQVGDDDPEWAARIAAHRERRPSWWRTVETGDVAHVLRTASGAVLIDGIGTWLAAAMDATGGWADPDAVRPRIDELIEAWRTTEARVVAVSDEVGLSPVPMTPAGRIFRDVAGRLNQGLAAESEEAALVVAGRILELS